MCVVNKYKAEENRATEHRVSETTGNLQSPATPEGFFILVSTSLAQFDANANMSSGFLHVLRPFSTIKNKKPKYKNSSRRKSSGVTVIQNSSSGLGTPGLN